MTKKPYTRIHLKNCTVPHSVLNTTGITSFTGIGDFFPKENPSNEISPEKPGSSVANEHPGTSSEEQGIEGIEEIVED